MIAEETKSAVSIDGGDDLAGDQRQDSRHAAFRAADLLLGEGLSPVAALVKDISKSGLRLHVVTPLKIPNRVRVILSHPRVEYLCDVVWRSDEEIGLRIVD